MKTPQAKTDKNFLNFCRLGRNGGKAEKDRDEGVLGGVYQIMSLRLIMKFKVGDKVQNKNTKQKDTVRLVPGMHEYDKQLFIDPHLGFVLKNNSWEYQEDWKKLGGDRMKKKQKKGFASMDPKEQKRIASMGGKAAHKKGTAHEWNSKEAQKAGRKGGLATQKKHK